MGPSDLWPNLPSFDELASHPRVAAAAERWRSSAVAARVRAAVDAVSAEVSRRAEGLSTVKPADLLDRLVQQIDWPSAPTAGEVINATGELNPVDALAPPLPPAALDAMRRQSEGFRAARSDLAAGAACRLLGAEAAVTLSGAVTGLGAVLRGSACDGVCVAARGELGELAAGVRLDSVCRESGAELIEVGATDHVTPATTPRLLPPQPVTGESSCCAIGRPGSALSAGKRLPSLLISSA